jgi:protein MpaA
MVRGAGGLRVAAVAVASALAGVVFAPAGGAQPAAAATTLGPGPDLPTARTIVIGHSVLGRRITARRVGNPDSPRKALVVGSIHGDEPEGLRVTRALRSMGGAAGVDLWVIDTVNPDGLAAHRRQNARGVDLNRNFATGWRATGPRGSRYYAGPRAFSAPESKAVRALVLRLRPTITLWYHQPYGYVIPPLGGGDLSIVRDYARLTSNAVRIPPGPRDPGMAPTWENATLPGSTAFIVELPAFPQPARVITRHARAAVRVAALGRRASRGTVPVQRALRPQPTGE